MIAEFTEEICFKLPKGEKQRLEQLVKEGKFKNLSQVVRAALQQFLQRS